MSNNKTHDRIIFALTFAVAGCFIGPQVINVFGYTYDDHPLAFGLSMSIGALTFALAGLGVSLLFSRRAKPGGVSWHMPDDEPDASGDEKRHVWQPRFRVTTFLLLTFVLSIAAASGYYLRRASEAMKTSTTYDVDRGHVFSFLAYTLAVPTLILVLVAVFWRFLPRSNGRR